MTMSSLVIGRIVDERMASTLPDEEWNENLQRL